MGRTWGGGSFRTGGAYDRGDGLTVGRLGADSGVREGLAGVRDSERVVDGIGAGWVRAGATSFRGIGDGSKRVGLRSSTLRDGEGADRPGAVRVTAGGVWRAEAEFERAEGVPCGRLDTAREAVRTESDAARVSER